VKTPPVPAVIHLPGASHVDQDAGWRQKLDRLRLNSLNRLGEGRRIGTEGSDGRGFGKCWAVTIPARREEEAGCDHEYRNTRHD
jgi:hypothetical protein